jgi:hypothetical protein
MVFVFQGEWNMASRFALLFSLPASLILGGSDSQVHANKSNLTEINRDDLEMGEVIFTGNFDRDGNCKIDTFKIQTTAPGNSDNQSWLGIMLDAVQCRALVNARWEGAIENGPSEVIDPLLSLQTLDSEQLVFMYGYGGTGDKLTRKTGKITFCYDGTNATITSQSGTCQGSNLGMGWIWLMHV